MARPPKCRLICSMPKVKEFGPLNIESTETIVLNIDEFEVLRQLDYVHFTQEKCAQRMNVSRTTVTRIYENARNKIAEAIVTGKKIVIEGGDVFVCKGLKAECANEPMCCHRPNSLDT
ncbi:MAG: DUF134 domain-containing protein [Candidatus Metalachnospira sp.]|nr:DUF134 domain-containing protein [Candidatus Metalachnospira sp.]